MGLSDRLGRQAPPPRRGGGDTVTVDTGVGSDAGHGASDTLQQPVVENSVAGAVPQLVDSDRTAALRERLHERLVSTLATERVDLDADPAELEARVADELNEALRAEGTPLSATDRADVLRRTMDDVLRLGPIQPLLDDPNVNEVMVNGPGQVYIEVGGRLTLTDVRFVDDAHVRRTIERIVSRVGRRIDESSPYVDARLPDGSRVNAVIPPVAVDHPTLTIRKFARQAIGAEELVQRGSMTEAARTFLEAVVRSRVNVLVSGGTGAGKTTTLNALSNFIPVTERIITIEDAAELQLQQPHVVRMEHRPPNIEGSGEVTIRQLVRNALRMRPDRIIVGEVRGGEALDMLQAMNTGHDGSISTVHANSPRDVLARLETMVLMSGVDLPLRAIREQVSSAVQLIVHQSRLADGSRRFTHISEITGMEGDTVMMQDIFHFDFAAGRNADGRFLGTLRPTGMRPALLQRLSDQGEAVPPSVFDPGDADVDLGW